MVFKQEVNVVKLDEAISRTAPPCVPRNAFKALSTGSEEVPNDLEAELV